MNSKKSKAPQFSFGRQQPAHGDPLERKATKFETPGVGKYSQEGNQYIKTKYSNSPQTKFGTFRREMFESADFAKEGTFCPKIKSNDQLALNPFEPLQQPCKHLSKLHISYMNHIQDRQEINSKYRCSSSFDLSQQQDYYGFQATSTLPEMPHLPKR